MYHIFVCYRREDCPYAALLVHAKLAAQFGQQAVFIDTETIRPADNWEAGVETVLVQCRNQLGPRHSGWSESSASGSRRDAFRY
jgi:hypothetical protein